jgi:hypothetical protein
MAVFPAKPSQDYEILEDEFDAQIARNNTACARIAAGQRERQDNENELATQLEAQMLQMEDTMQSTERAMARVPNTQWMNMEENVMTAEEDLRKQRFELASNKGEMKANKT